MIKWIFLFLVSSLIPSIGYSGTSPYILGSVVEITPISWWADLSLEDNAANTTVVNNGTGGNFTATTNTSNLTNQTSSPEGSRNFNLVASGGYTFYSSANFTSEKFELIFWYRTSTLAASQVLIGVKDPDGTIEANETILILLTTGYLRIAAYGNSGSYGLKEATDNALSTNTWYRIRYTVDATVSGWVVHVYVSTDGISESEVTFGSWTNSTPAAAVFNNTLYIGSTGNNGYYFDHIKLRSTE